MDREASGGMEGREFDGAALKWEKKSERLINVEEGKQMEGERSKWSECYDIE